MLARLVCEICSRGRKAKQAREACVRNLLARLECETCSRGMTKRTGCSSAASAPATDSDLDGHVRLSCAITKRWEKVDLQVCATSGRTAGLAQNGTGALIVCAGPSRLLAQRPGRVKKLGAAAIEKSEQEPTSPMSLLLRIRSLATGLLAAGAPRCRSNPP